MVKTDIVVLIEDLDLMFQSVGLELHYATLNELIIHSKNSIEEGSEYLHNYINENGAKTNLFNTTYAKEILRQLATQEPKPIKQQYRIYCGNGLEPITAVINQSQGYYLDCQDYDEYGIALNLDNLKRDISLIISKGQKEIGLINANYQRPEFWHAVMVFASRDECFFNIACHNDMPHEIHPAILSRSGEIKYFEED